MSSRSDEGSTLTSSWRELTPSLAKTLRRCHSTVRELRNRLRRRSPGSSDRRGPVRDLPLLGGQLVDGLHRPAAHLLPRCRPARGARGLRTPPCRSVRACRAPSRSCRARRRAAPPDAATRRTAGGRGPAPARHGNGPVDRSPRDRAVRGPVRETSARERASMPSAHSVPAAGCAR